MPEWLLPFPRTVGARRAELEAARKRLLDELQAARTVSGAELTAEAGSPRTTPETLKEHWSVAEVAYHLHLSENSIARLLRKMLASGERSDEASDERLLEEWERIRTMVGSRAKKVPAPERVVPKDAPALERSLDLLADSRRLILEVLDAAAERDLRSIYAPHPLRGLGTLAGSSWLSVVAFHEWRHAEQIRELRGASLSG